jgi:hypothetical protein
MSGGLITLNTALDTFNCSVRLTEKIEKVQLLRCLTRWNIAALSFNIILYTINSSKLNTSSTQVNS